MPLDVEVEALLRQMAQTRVRRLWESSVEEARAAVAAAPRLEGAPVAEVVDLDVPGRRPHSGPPV